MSSISLGVLLIGFGVLFLLNSMGLIKYDYCLEFLNLADKYWPVFLILLGLQILLKDKSPELGRFLKWLLILLAGLWLFCVFFIERSWVI